jgi:hypothetical protein
MGLAVVAYRGKELPHDAISEAVAILQRQQFADGGFAPGRRAFHGETTLCRTADGT